MEPVLRHARGGVVRDHACSPSLNKTRVCPEVYIMNQINCLVNRLNVDIYCYICYNNFMTMEPNGSVDLKRAHWDRYNPVNELLRQVVEPLATDFAQAVEALDRDHDVLTTCNTYKLPHGSVSKLPPALFGTILKDSITRDRPLEVPEDETEIDKMVNDYYAWAVALAQTGDYAYVNTPTPELLGETMRHFKGQSYPEEQWNASALVTQQALNQEPLFTIDVHRVAQINGGAYELSKLSPNLRSMYRQHTDYSLAISQLIPEDGRTSSVRELVQLPIGQYGQEASERLAKAVVVLGDFMRTSPAMAESIVRMTEDENVQAVLRKHTMRTRESFDRGDLAHIKNGVSDALIGGILTMAQTISFLASEKVPGYDNFDDLVNDILDSDVLEDFARIAPVGYIGPVTLAGIYVPGALETSDGKLSLSTEFRKHLGEMRRGYFAGMAAKWALYDEAPTRHAMPRTLGLTCPASEPDGAIATLRPVLKSFLVH